MHELPQKPYNDGIDAKKDAAKRIDYRPYGFTVGRVLSKDFSEIFNPNGVVDGWKEKEKASFHVEVRISSKHLGCSLAEGFMCSWLLLVVLRRHLRTLFPRTETGQERRPRAPDSGDLRHVRG